MLHDICWWHATASLSYMTMLESGSAPLVVLTRRKIETRKCSFWFFSWEEGSPSPRRIPHGDADGQSYRDFSDGWTGACQPQAVADAPSRTKGGHLCWNATGVTVYTFTSSSFGFLGGQCFFLSLGYGLFVLFTFLGSVSFSSVIHNDGFKQIKRFRDYSD